MENNQDIIKLLEPIHNVVHNHRHTRSNKEPWSWVLVEWCQYQYLNYFLTYQKGTESLAEYLKKWKALADIIDTFGDEVCGFHLTIFGAHKKALAAKYKLGTTAAGLTLVQGISRQLYS
jgi:hypothetical protein